MERENRQPQKRPSKRENRRRGSVVGKIFFALFTLLLIGVLTGGMVAAIFMKYVETNITPVVQVNADDYTMALSSIIYYKDDEVTENDGWVEYQTVHGEQNRIYVSFDQMPDALWQAAVSIEYRGRHAEYVYWYEKYLWRLHDYPAAAEKHDGGQ